MGKLHFVYQGFFIKICFKDSHFEFSMKNLEGETP